MIALLVILGALGATAVVGTLVVTARDGYRRTPTADFARV